MKIIILVLTALILQSCTRTIHMPVLIEPSIFHITIQENHEPLIDLKHQNIIAYGHSPEIANNADYTKMRKTVYDKLVQAQQLLPSDLRFCLYEGYRSSDTQDKIFQTQYKKIKNANPVWKDEGVFKETAKLITPITNLDGSQNTPMHATGGAIDVYLIDIDNKPVDMGINPSHWKNNLDGTLEPRQSPLVSEKAQANRKIMSDVLTEVGFVNYPEEYWHWSYGDQYWAHHTKHKYAIYGSVK